MATIQEMVSAVVQHAEAMVAAEGPLSPWGLVTYRYASGERDYPDTDIEAVLLLGAGVQTVDAAIAYFEGHLTQQWRERMEELHNEEAYADWYSEQYD